MGKKKKKFIDKKHARSYHVVHRPDFVGGDQPYVLQPVETPNLKVHIC
jgi:hypothetical protein